MTASRSPTAFATSSHMSRKAFCKNCCTGTAFPCLSLMKSFGAKISPPQKRVLYNACKTRRQLLKMSKLTTWLQLPVSYIHMATVLSQPRHGHHHVVHAAMQPQCPQRHVSRSLRALASRLVLQNHPSSVTIRLGASKRTQLVRSEGIARVVRGYRPGIPYRTLR